MKSNKHSNKYSNNSEVLTELLGQLIGTGGRRRGNGGGGGGGGGSSSSLSRPRSSIRRSAGRYRRRALPGLTRSGRPKPATSETEKKGGAQKRSATESGGSESKKQAVEKKDAENKEDPYLRGLSESGVRWYRRFLKEGLEAKAACRKAWEQHTEPAEFEPQWGREFLTNKDGEEEARNRQKSRRKKKAEANEDLRIAVYPKDFPEQMFDLATAVALEASIMENVAKGADAKLQFTYAHLRPGALLIDCVNEETVTWLRDVVNNLPSWEGPELTTSLERVIPDAYVLTMALPKSNGQAFDKTLALLAAQNEDLNTEVWKLVNEREENEKQLVTIRVDKDSFTTIKMTGYKLYYRFEKVFVHFHRYLRYDNPIMWITNPSCLKQNQVKPPGPSGSK